MNNTELSQLCDFYYDKLFDECLPFWLRHAVDREHGGFITALDRDGTIVDTDKNVWQQGRFTWLLAELFNDDRLARHPDRDSWLETAVHGAEFMKKHCFDESDSRMWFHLDRKGQPIRKRRYAYSESFAAIAFGELALATDDVSYKSLAESCFEKFLSHNRSPTSPETQAKFTDVRPTLGLGFPMISIVTAQQLRQSIELVSANDLIGESIADIEAFFVKPDIQCVMETVAADGSIIDHFDGRTLNPGHAIEAAWFIMAEAKHRDDSKLLSLGCNIFDWMLKRGWDSEHGGILYFVDVYGHPVQEYWHDMKFWWPHNEAIIASLLAYSATRDEEYLTTHRQIHDWSFQHFADPEHGEWFGYLHRDGTVSSTLKGNMWKGPFHYPRMLLTCWRILRDLLDEPKLGY